MEKITYPSADKIIEFNLLALSTLKVKRADQPKVLSYSKIDEALKRCEETEGDIYDKAAALLRGIIKQHAFASGNRRTAFITTKYFLLQNKAKLGIKDNPAHAKVMQGIRENHYTDDEIKEWIINGKIREFKR